MLVLYEELKPAFLSFYVKKLYRNFFTRIDWRSFIKLYMIIKIMFIQNEFLWRYSDD